MNRFAYLGLDSQGRTVSGSMVARDETNLEERLREAGLWLVEAEPEAAAVPRKARAGWTPFGARPRRRDLIDFCTVMSFQLKAGITILQAMTVAAEDCPSPRFRQVIQELRSRVESGESFAESLERYPGTFSKQFIALMRAGEQSGTLPDTFLELRRHLEWQEQTISDVRQATLYPAITLAVVCVFVLVLFTFVIPKFVDLLTVARVPLPTMTKVIFAISNFAKATWYLWVGGLVLGPLLVQFARRRSHRFDVACERLKFKLPIYGFLCHLMVMSRFARNVAILYRSGITIVQSLKLTVDLVGSALVADAITDVWQRLEVGENLSAALKRHPVFSSLLIRMVALGETTGTLDKSLENVSDYYNLVIPRWIRKLITVLEPCLIIFLVGIVGCVALSIFLPILSLMDSIR